MTDTAAPAQPSIMQQIWDRTVAAFLAHWDKALNLALGAIVMYLGVWIAGLVSKPPAPPQAPRIEVVRTAPDTSAVSAELAALRAEIGALTEKVEGLTRKKVKRRAASTKPLK